MLRVGSDGRVTVVVKDHYLKKLIFISQQDYVAGARICSPTRMTKRHGPRGIPRGFPPLWALASVRSGFVFNHPIVSQFLIFISHL